MRQRLDQLVVPLPRRPSGAPSGAGVVTTARLPVLTVASADRLCRLHRVRSVCRDAIAAIDAALSRRDGTP